MHDRLIKNTLEEIAAPVRTLNDRLGGLLSSKDTEQAKAELSKLYDRVTQALRQHNCFTNPSSRFFGEKQLLLGPAEQTKNLMDVFFDRGSDQALVWLHKIYKTECTNIRIVAEIYGLALGGSFSLSNNVTLMPLNKLPASSITDRLRREHSHAPPSFYLPRVPPVGATIIRTNVHASDKFDVSRLDRNTFERSIKAFTLVDHATPIIGKSWLEFEDHDLCLADTGMIGMEPRDEGTLLYVPAVSVDQSAICKVNKYLSLDNSSFRNKCDLAIDRLNMARRRRAPGDKAIEGGGMP